MGLRLCSLSLVTLPNCRRFFLGTAAWMSSRAHYDSALHCKRYWAIIPVSIEGSLYDLVNIPCKLRHTSRAAFKPAWSKL